MPFYSVRPVKGIVKDRPGHQLEPGEWTAGTNVIYRDGAIQKCKGYSQVLSIATEGGHATHGALHDVDFVAQVAVRDTSTTKRSAIVYMGDTYASFIYEDAVITDAHDNLQSLGGTVSVTNLTRSGNVATATAAGHGLSVGNVCRVTGADQSEYNGHKYVASVAGNDFTFSVNSGATSPATGTITVRRATPLTTTGGLPPGWNFTQIGATPVFNHYANNPQMWDTDGNTMADLTNWPASTVCRVLREFDQRLWALDVTDSGTRYEQRVKWSQAVANGPSGTVPASWDDTDVSTTAGELDLPGYGGPVVDLVPLGDAAIIYQNGISHIVRFVGGAFIYDFDLLFRDLGAIAPDCVVEHGGLHYVFTGNDLRVHDGHSHKSIADGKWRAWLHDNTLISTGTGGWDNAFLFVDRHKETLWLGLVTSGSTADTAILYDIRTGQFGTRSLPGILNMSQGYESWHDETGATDGIHGGYIVAGRNTSAPSLIRLEDTNQEAGANMTANVTRDEIQIGSPTEVKHLKSVYLHLEADDGAAFTVTVGGRDYYGQTLNTTSYTYTHGTDRRVTCDVKARIPYIQIQTTTDVAWKLYGYDIEYVIAGTG